jgi:sulfur-carrier protein adenylyltransferase/sulfurtransferase
MRRDDDVPGMTHGATPGLSPAELSRYSRHLLLDEIGLAGQQRLAAARVLVIGAGGLGSPAALYLAAAGVGTLGIADFDQVEEHNLQRQLLHQTASIGQPKVTSAARSLRDLNPHIHIVEHGEGVSAANALSLFEHYDVIVDGTDNFPARYVNNDAAFVCRKPLVHGSVFKFEGQVAVFDPARGSPCYRCLFPEPPPAGSVPGCGEAGVVGALCGVIGSLQALETIKLVVGMGEPLIGRLLTYDGLTQSFETFAIHRDPTCPLCSEQARGRAHPLKHEATMKDSPKTAQPDSSPDEISVSQAHALLQKRGRPAVLVDVREPWEFDICSVPGSMPVPMRQVPDRMAELPRDVPLLLLCHHGTRSRGVTQFLRAHGFSSATNVAGGIAAWAEQIDPSLRRY